MALLAALLAGTTGCITTDTSVCSVSGKICPTTYTCTADGQDCILGVCGNGVMDPDEVCDDGNIRDGDSCSGDCSTIMSCGNGLLEPQYGEVCDDGNNLDADGCSLDCMSDETCGNGVLDLTVGEACDDGNFIDGDGCTMDCVLETCGDGILDSDNGEICDDGNNDPGDHCSPNCRVEPMVVAGAEHSCALLDTGTVRCWGRAYLGQLGYGNEDNIGDNETPASAGDVDIPGVVYEISAGNNHTCALIEDGAVYCWGSGQNGRLGQGNVEDIGDNEAPSAVPAIDLGGITVQISAGSLHTCALLEGGTIRCWGEGDYGRLGYGNTDDIGDDETPTAVGVVDIGGLAVKVVASTHHTCALLDTGSIRCWGLGNVGRLGYPNGGSPIGDNELPSAAGDVMVGGLVRDFDLGVNHTCALMDTGAVRCWGTAELGQLGYGNGSRIGDDEHPEAAGDVNVGGLAQSVAAGGSTTCAIIGDEVGPGSAVRCWGWNDRGQLGLGFLGDIGDDEEPSSVGPIDVGGTVIQLSVGSQHVCALLDTHGIRCWGLNGQGRLGNNLGNIGDDEVPSSIDEVPYR